LNRCFSNRHVVYVPIGNGEAIILSSCWLWQCRLASWIASIGLLFRIVELSR
jgi:hypothetical protein